MAQVIMVEYTLRGPGKNYKRLTEILEKEIQAHARKKIMDSTWVFVTDSGVQEVYRLLREVVDENDHMLVVTLRRDAMWSPGFSQDTKNWLGSYLIGPSESW